jgi:DNA processing protein
MNNLHRLQTAVALFRQFKTPAKVAKYLNDVGVQGAEERSLTFGPDILAGVASTALDLDSRGVSVIFGGEAEYPEQLKSLRNAPEILFIWGNKDLLRSASVGMCGSRKATERGLAAARKCGGAIALSGLTIVSGYATGVDTETHLGALESGGTTIIVLAEGIMHFKRKRNFINVEFDASHVLVVSQFAPMQPWNVGAAMTRNALIYGLGKALVVIEAGDTGGTLQAGLGALAANKPVLALGFESDTPNGNKILIEKGAIEVSTSMQLGNIIHAIQTVDVDKPVTAQQLTLI